MDHAISRITSEIPTIQSCAATRRCKILHTAAVLSHAAYARPGALVSIACVILLSQIVLTQQRVDLFGRPDVMVNFSRL